ncbi:MAG: tRNA (guanosine(37)-N1)-methyltransferase TrmD [Bacilli bacterium]|nr:tRNA (guanosine(37)-N1)-methyltransferase TrmD [Bacilli bacterium]MBN2877750.1 tRNA (guanosine(37)-N1)-methyltransferase TrmD [Bacilli bacterium]
MKITVLTLFPEMFPPVLDSSMLKRAQANDLIDFELVNFRDFSTNKHMTVDDSPYGGGAGMVLSVEPIYHALQSVEGSAEALKILLTPQGKTFDQTSAKQLVDQNHIILICGHYEGFDERVRSFVDLELSIGDFVMTGGEIAAMAIIDSVTRLIPGVLGSSESFEHDSFYEDSLDYPQYTKPREFMGQFVPDVLLSGNHEEIAKWREEMKKKRTQERRPDLLKKSQ